MTDRFESGAYRLLDKNEDERHLAYYVALGRFVTRWAGLEHQFNLNVMKLYRNHGDPKQARRPPVPMTEKILFWRNTFATAPELESLANDASRIIAGLDELREDRNTLLHYNWPEMLSSPDPDGVRGVVLKSAKGGFMRGEATLTLEIVHDMINRAVKLNAQMLVVTMGLNRRSPEPRTERDTSPEEH